MSETFDFGDGNGPVPAHRHQNKVAGQRTPGGWVADTAFVSPDAFVGESALVWGQAQVYEGVSIYGEAQIFGSAQVRVKTVPRDDLDGAGGCTVNLRHCDPVLFNFGDGAGPVPARRHKYYGRDKTIIGGVVAETARVASTVYLAPDARVFGRAVVSENVKIHDNARIFGEARVFGDAVVCGRARVHGSARVFGDAFLKDDAEVSGSVQLSGKVSIHGSARLRRPEDLRTGEGWVAYRKKRGIWLLMEKHQMYWIEPVYTELSSWRELPKALHDHGCLSVVEYLAQALAAAQEREP